MRPRSESDAVEGNRPDFCGGNRPEVEDTRPFEEVRREPAHRQADRDGDEGEIHVGGADVVVADELVEQTAGRRRQRGHRQPRHGVVGKAHPDDDRTNFRRIHPRDAQRAGEKTDECESDCDDVRHQRHLPGVQRLPGLPREPSEVGADTEPLVEETQPGGSGDCTQRNRRAIGDEQQYRKGEQRGPERHEDGLAELLVGEKLLEQVVGRFDVTGLPDDHAVDGIDRDATLDNRNEALVLRAIDDNDRRFRTEVGNQRLYLSGDFAVGRDGVAGSGDDGDGRVLDVLGDAKPLQQTVDATVFGVFDADGRDERFDGLAADDGRVCAREAVATVKTDDERAHSRQEAVGE